MRAEDIVKLLRTRPFEPFRIHLTDRTSWTIDHPELAMVDRSKVIVGVPGKSGAQGPMADTVFCSLLHITRVERANGA